MDVEGGLGVVDEASDGFVSAVDVCYCLLEVVGFVLVRSTGSFVVVRIVVGMDP